MPQEVKEQMLPIVLENYKNRTRQSMNDIVKVDSSLAMQLMLVAKQHGYDTNQLVALNMKKSVKRLAMI